nr:putative disease resistance RPP13-like protein 1 [Ziziphus jujuba var. spinosa]
MGSDTWKMEECNILPALWLSYNYLPPQPKRCFAYCSIFPKDFEIEKERLILLWTAEDLLLSQENMTLEEIGENYFNDLVSRSFIHYTKGVVFPHYHMHDLVNDLASFVSGEFCLRMGDGSLKGITGKIRHLSYMTSKSHDIKKLEEYSSKSKVLRSLLFDSRILCVQFLANLEQYLKGMRCLRVLSLCENHIMTCSSLVPITISLDLIGNLKLLSSSSSGSSSMINAPILVPFKSLESLRLKDFSELREWKEWSLMMGGDVRGGEDKNGGCNIRELGNLQDLRGFFGIKNLENILNVGDVREAKLKDKRRITVVELEWCGETDDSEKAREVLEGLQPNTNVQNLRILNYKGTSFPSWIGHHSFSHIVYLSLSGCGNCYLLPPLGQLPSLKDLELRGFAMVERIGDEFYYSCNSSSSSGSSSMINAPILVPFKSLESLRLKDFSELREWKEWSLMMGGDVRGGEGTRAFPLLNLKSLAKQGWPSNLKSLRIGSCKNLLVDVDSFPEEGQLPTTLTRLKLVDLKKLKSLHGKALRDLVCLERLSIKHCHQLPCLPEERLPGSLSQLTITSSLGRLAYRCKRDTGEDWPKIAHIPRIKVVSKSFQYLIRFFMI